MWTLLLGLLACGGGSDDGPKQWLLLTPLKTVDDGEPDDPYGLYCGDDFAWSDNWTLDLATNEAGPLPNNQPANWSTGETGPVTCVGRTLFTFAPGLNEIYQSHDGGPWEEMAPTEEGVLYDTIMASSRGVVYRSSQTPAGIVGPRIEQSFDAGATWEVLNANLNNPTGDEATYARIFGVEGFLTLSVLDAERFGGSVRMSLDGTYSILSNDFHRNLESTVPLAETADGTFLAYDPNGANVPDYFFPSYLSTQRDPIELPSADYEPVMLAGPKYTLDHPDPTQHPQALTVRLHPDGHLLRRDDMRTTTALGVDQREEVLLGDNCEVWEWSTERHNNTRGPTSVSLSHTGTEPVWVGGFQSTRLAWFTPDGAAQAEMLQPGGTLTLESNNGIVFFMDELGRCRGALLEHDGGERDVAYWL